MKRVLYLLISLLALGLISCEKQADEPTVFDIYGKWGVTTVTYTYPDKPSVYLEEFKSHYYEYWTFQINGFLIVKLEGTAGTTKYGDFTYYENKRQVNYRFEGTRRSITATIVEHSPTSMTFIADYQEVGRIIYTMKKVAW